MANTIDDIRTQMISEGIDVPDGYQLIDDGKTHRFIFENKAGQRKYVWYRIYRNMNRAGVPYFSGAFGFGANTYTIHKDIPSPSAMSSQTPPASVAPDVESAVSEIPETDVIMHAHQIWDSANPASDNNSYAIRKRIRPYGARESQGNLLVPVHDFETPLAGLQTISDTSKRFLPGQRMSGRFFSFGLENNPSKIYVTEGYATGCTIHEATQGAIVVAFSASNLSAVCQVLRNHYPKSEIVICSDDDRFFRDKAIKYVRDELDFHDFIPQASVTEYKHDDETIRFEDTGLSITVSRSDQQDKACSRRFENTGRIKAFAAANDFHCQLVIPKFSDVAAGTDFNDLASAEGLKEVREQLTAPRETSSDIIAPLLERFLYVFPQGLLYDKHQNQYAKESVFITMFLNNDKKLKKAWLKQRHRIESQNIVFNPNEEVMPGQINTFQGWGIKPTPGKCDLILAHLKNILCGGDDDAFTWMLRWLAFPLQNPGAKMDTAPVFYGKEGTGKSLFFERVMSPIYGQYARSISPAELRCPFNEWLSHKLFIVCEEVISDQDGKFQKSMLKNYITAETFSIQQKHMDARIEKARANFVFLSNEIQPLRLDSSDRRYMVIRVNHVETKEYFKELMGEINHGGVSAFFDYLKHVDLGDFTKSVPVIETNDHNDLMELGKNSALRFFESWIRQECLGLTVGPVASQDLYEAYVEWCRRVGEPRAMPKNYCLASIKQIDRVATERILLKNRASNGTALYHQTTVIFPNQTSQYLDKDEIQQHVDAFHHTVSMLRS